jgi:hypothetical protein
MLSNTVSKNASLLQAALKPMTLVQTQARGYMPYYQKKYDDYFKPRYFDNVRRQPQNQGRVKYNTQDPLFFDYRHSDINGGIQMVSLINYDSLLVLGQHQG